MFPDLQAAAMTVLSQAFPSIDVPLQWTVPQEESHGDATTNIALQIARSLGKQPREIAEMLSQELQSFPMIAKVDVAGAGYVNVWLTNEALLRELQESVDAAQPRAPSKKADPIIVEYSQPNIAKPLGVHHLIGTVLGQATVNMHRFAGDTVISWNYIGDWGTQFGKLAVAYEKWGAGKPVLEHKLDDLLSLYVRFHDETEKYSELEDQGREAFRKLEQGDKKLRAFWEDVVTITKESLADVYQRLHVSFDLDLGESFYEDKMESVLEEGRKKGVFTIGEGGALIVQFPEEKNMPPYLVLKGDGATLYSTRDLAQMRYRIDTYHPKAIYIFTDIAQKLHFEQLFETCTMLGWTDMPTFENVLFGRMRFTDKSMSTRKGNILHLEQVLDEAVRRAEVVIAEHEEIQAEDTKELAEMMGIGALVYGILSQNRKMDLVFDWDRMLSFEGNSAPYLQYTHARARSVLAKSGDSSFGDLTLIRIDELSERERVLIRTLLRFPSVLEEATATHMPHKLANFLYELAQAFNAFYNSDPILQAEEPMRRLRLALTFFAAELLQVGASLLTLRLPNRM